LQSLGHQAQKPAYRLESDSDSLRRIHIRTRITVRIRIPITDMFIRIGTGRAFTGITASVSIFRGRSTVRGFATGIVNRGVRL
jgi:hypothetical protein